jgi:hypothetical protein
MNSEIYIGIIIGMILGNGHTTSLVLGLSAGCLLSNSGENYKLLKEKIAQVKDSLIR